MTPGLGNRLPLTASTADVTRMEADGLLRVAISAEQEGMQKRKKSNGKGSLAMLCCKSTIQLLDPTRVAAGEARSLWHGHGGILRRCCGVPHL